MIPISILNAEPLPEFSISQQKKGNTCFILILRYYFFYKHFMSYMILFYSNIWTFASSNISSCIYCVDTCIFLQSQVVFRFGLRFLFSELFISQFNLNPRKSQFKKSLLLQNKYQIVQVSSLSYLTPRTQLHSALNREWLMCNLYFLLLFCLRAILLSPSFETPVDTSAQILERGMVIVFYGLELSLIKYNFQ